MSKAGFTDADLAYIQAPSRDRLIEAARLRFPDVFTSAVSP